MIPVAGAAFIEAEGPALAIQQDPMLNSLKFERTEEIRGNFSLGYTAALGLEYNLKSNLALFVEAEALHLNVTRNTGEFTTFRFVNQEGNVAQDLREVLPASQLRTNFVDALGANSNNPRTNPTGFDADRPQDLPTSTSFYHHISAQVGVKFRF
ncbi:hypothetical protein A3SI_19741 [Nitritalea halalkaliphila LW7]|uniref:Outer membrane protein beta-barrel domain-containing protein n=2 Tax=Nitritalea TaxID=1187887 RepID=I5BS77_9BACT|nr:hypothetical protein A3SI_19741 [Nitritalea halalkaliphila LW7]